MIVGVLALQGAFVEHITRLRALEIEAIEVRTVAELERVDGLIIPGGESTVIGKLAHESGLLAAIKRMAQQGKPVWGTCAGLILLAQDVGRDQPTLELMDITVQRNAFGRQLDSFMQELKIPVVNVALEERADKPFPAVFIRAPIVTRIGPQVEALSTLNDGKIVAVKQGNLLGTSFHPELTADDRLHRYFIRLIVGPGRASV